MNHMKKFLCAMAMLAALGFASRAQASVISWLSDSDALDGTASPSDSPHIDQTGGDVGWLYIWAQNTTKLNSLAYDVLTSDPDKVMITDREMYNPLVFGALNRWDPPTNLGQIDPAGNLINMYGIAVTAQGLNPATNAGDAGYDPVAGAALIGVVHYQVKGDPCVGVACMMVPVQISLADGQYGTYEGANQADTTNGSATVWVRMPIIPEPASVTLVGLAMLGLVGFARRRR